MIAPLFPVQAGPERFDKSWAQRCHISHTTRAVVSHMILGGHYLGKFPGVSPCVLGLFCDLQPIGVLIFSLPPRETMARYGVLTWELSRLWVSDDMPGNTETWFIAQAIRHVRKDHPEVGAIVSYADPSAGHSGTIYRAANFTPDGMTDSERLTPRTDYMANGIRYQRRAHVPEGANVERVPRVSKHRYVYWIDRAKAA